MDQNDTNLKNGCRLVLQYFGIFWYPLTAQEIQAFCPVQAKADEIDLALRELIADKIVYYKEGYYLPEDNPDWVEERRKSNSRA